MKKMKIRIIALLSLVAVAVSSCYSVGLQDLTSDPDYDGNKTSTFRIFKVLQFDDVNVSGIDILPYFDFFNTFRLTLTYKDGKISSMSMDNGDVPFSRSMVLKFLLRQSMSILTTQFIRTLSAGQTPRKSWLHSIRACL